MTVRLQPAFCRSLMRSVSVHSFREDSERCWEKTKPEFTLGYIAFVDSHECPIKAHGETYSQIEIPPRAHPERERGGGGGGGGGDTKTANVFFKSYFN